MLVQSGSEAEIRVHYNTLILRMLRSDEAAFFLVGYAYEGYRGAIEIMELLFPSPSSGGDPQNNESGIGHMDRNPDAIESAQKKAAPAEQAPDSESDASTNVFSSRGF